MVPGDPGGGDSPETSSTSVFGLILVDHTNIFAK